MNKIVDLQFEEKGGDDSNTTTANISTNRFNTNAAIEWLRILYENKNYNQVIDYLENMKFIFTYYLNDAKSGVEKCKLLCLTNKWSINSSHYDKSLSKEIGIDADEYILNLFTNMSTLNIRIPTSINHHYNTVSSSIIIGNSSNKNDNISMLNIT